MSLLKNFTNDESIQNETDRIGGGGVLATGVYPAQVKLAYISQAKSEAVALNLHLETSEGREVRQQLWISSGKDKGCKNYYEKNGEKFYLPGYLLAESLALLTVGKSISDLDTEDKVVGLYNFEAKAEVPTKVPVVMELLNKDVLVGIIKQTVDKNVKDGNGNYVPSGETRDENEIDKFFRARDGMTTAEIRAQAEKAVFIDTWKAKNGPDFVRNKAKGAAAGGIAGAPKAGAGAAAGATKKPTTSLFA
jgi:hypothetical protein